MRGLILEEVIGNENGCLFRKLLAGFSLSFCKKCSVGTCLPCFDAITIEINYKSNETEQ